VALAARASKVSAITEKAAQFLPGAGNKWFFQVGARKEWTRFHIPVTELIRNRSKTSYFSIRLRYRNSDRLGMDI
jgi:hypothetical protein